MVMALARAIAIAMECPTVDRTFGMLAPAQRATPGKGLRLASQTLIPGHVRREPDVGHPTPEARLLPTYANLRAAPNSHQRRKKKNFLFLRSQDSASRQPRVSEKAGETVCPDDVRAAALAIDAAR